jgi:Nif-specific regulatory protein
VKEKVIRVGREVEELPLLYEISRSLARSMDLREVVGPVLKAIAQRIGMLRGTLTLLDRDTGEIFIEEAYGLSPRQQRRGRYHLGEGVTGQVVQTGQPAIIPRISRDPRFLDRTGARKKQEEGDFSFICVPIKLGSEVIGALSMDRPCGESVSHEEDVRLLSIIAAMLAQAVRLRQSVYEERRRLMEENTRLREELRDRFRPANIIGNSRAMQDVYDLIQRVSWSSTTVLISGESGTGKELVAHAIHYNSPRAGKPFVKVSCSALPESLIESELFGHEKGAFTGATAARRGRFELASGGTIFLDEIGDLSPAIQVKLLRVLQEREFERVGGTATIQANVRVLAATNRDLSELIKEGTFRPDLFYRLNVFPIHIPPPLGSEDGYTASGRFLCR